MPRNVVYTIGHSTRSADAFVGLLEAHGVTCLGDVRTVPRSRHNPQFNGETLAATLASHAIGYERMQGLGGFRKTTPDSPNAGWRNASFRGYADYMQTEEFAAGLATLEQISRRRPTAIMCAEAVPWRCHRSLIADALTVAGWRVLHIQSRRTARPHRRTPFLRVRGGALRYPALPSAADA